MTKEPDLAITEVRRYTCQWCEETEDLLIESTDLLPYGWFFMTTHGQKDDDYKYASFLICGTCAHDENDGEDNPVLQMYACFESDKHPFYPKGFQEILKRRLSRHHVEIQENDTLKIVPDKPVTKTHE